MASRSNACVRGTLGVASARTRWRAFTADAPRCVVEEGRRAWHSSDSGADPRKAGPCGGARPPRAPKPGPWLASWSRQRSRHRWKVPGGAVSISSPSGVIRRSGSPLSVHETSSRSPPQTTGHPKHGRHPAAVRPAYRSAMKGTLSGSSSSLQPAHDSSVLVRRCL